MYGDTLGACLGGCLNLQFAWVDDAELPMDLTGRSLRIVEPSCRDLDGAVIDMAEAAAGKIRVHFPEAVVATLRPGRSNWFRLALLLEDGCEDISARVWIDLM